MKIVQRGGIFVFLVLEEINRNVIHRTGRRGYMREQSLWLERAMSTVFEGIIVIRGYIC